LIDNAKKYNKEIFGDYYNKNNPQLVTFFETKSALDRKRNIYRSGRNIDRKRRRTKSLGEISKQAAKEYLGGCVMFPK